MDNLEQALNSRESSSTAKQGHLTRVELIDPVRAEPKREVDDKTAIVSGRPSPSSEFKSEVYIKSMGQTASSRSGSPESPGDRDQ